MDTSIVIPTFNRVDTLLGTLDALGRVDYPADRWEVIVVDDGSTDDTQTAVARWIGTAAVNVHYIKQKNAGPAAARNRGAQTAKGRYLIFVDNDISVEPPFVRLHVDALSQNPGCWILGRVTHPPILRESPFGRYRDELFEAFHEGHASDRLSETVGMTTQNVSMPLEDFRRLGGFDESFTIASCEDWELAWRARQTGTRVLYHPGIVALHNDWAVSLERFCERQRLYSISDVLLWQKYGAASPRVRVVRENGFVNWREDTAEIILKKLIKRLLTTTPAMGLIRVSCKLAERLAPGSRMNHRAYRLAEAIAIFRGVREGLRLYAAPVPTGPCASGLEGA